MATELETLEDEHGIKRRTVSIEQRPEDPASPFLGNEDRLTVTRHGEDEFVWVEAEWHQLRLRVLLTDLHEAVAKVSVPLV